MNGRSISSVVEDLRSGVLTSEDLPVQYIVREGTKLVVNNRSALALRRAGIPESQWNVTDMTGVWTIETDMTDRLLRNGLSNAGTSTVRVTGAGSKASALVE